VRTLPIRLPLLALLALLGVGEVLAVKTHAHVAGAWSTAAAVVLAPVAVTMVVVLAGRVGRRTAVAAAVVYLVLPFAGRLYFYGAFLQVYDHEVMPALVGLRHTGWFALGLAIAAAVLVLPERIAAAAGAVAAGAAAVAWVDTSWTALYGEFHETTWSPTLLCYLPFAAVVGLATRRPWLATAVGGWFAVLLLRGVNRPYYAGGLWLSLAAATPAIALLLTSLALLVPPLPLPRRLRPADDR
jgi:hypothetical protein